MEKTEDPFVQGKQLSTSESEVEVEVTGNVIKCFQMRCLLPGYESSMWTSDHDHAVMDYCYEKQAVLLVAYIDKQYGELHISSTVPNHENTDYLIYFIKKPFLEEISEKDFVQQFQWGTLRKKYFDGLLRLMGGLCAPLVFNNKSWPDSIRNDFSAHLHRFLATLTDMKYKMKSKTVLYIPSEGMELSEENAASDKSLVQRLESAMIHWTRQIKEVLNAQEVLETSESSGPLEEIEFWNNRCKDLSGLSDQLDKKGVKHIESVLKIAKSSYVTPFKRLAKQIQDGSAQAQSNRKFLKLLEEPCQALYDATPVDAPKLLPNIIKIIRIIWVNSEHFNTRERLTQLFRKLSNEVIRICCREIDLNRVFDGFVNSSLKVLQNCIHCCQQWKEIYKFNAEVQSVHSEKGWLLDRTSIFAQIDAFIQRCKDLVEICDCQRLFDRRLDGDQSPMRLFSGQRGPSIQRSVLEIEGTFQKHLQALRPMKRGILDVKNPAWHDEYNKFRTGVKDLEVMVQNLISSAFETVRTVEDGLMLLEIFIHLSARESIKRAIDRKTAEVYQMFSDELSSVKKELSSKQVNMLSWQPKYAGSAHWARGMKRRIDRTMRMLDEAKFLPEIGQGTETRATYQLLASALDDFVRKMFNEWTHHVDEHSSQRLEIPLMQKGAVMAGMLNMNFDKTLLILFTEIHYWVRLTFEIPHYVNAVYSMREDLRSLREHVLLVVRDYNGIIESLTVEERGLFKERIKFLDKKINPGLGKLSWASQGVSEFFVQECRNNAKKIQTIVDDYKAANMKVAENCHKISNILLVNIDGNNVYEELGFEEDQEKHKGKTVHLLLKHYNDIITTLRQTYNVFAKDPTEVQAFWASYVYRMDSYVEQAFRLNIKSSLLEIAKAINGDGKTTPNPLFKVEVVLEPGAGRHNVPTVDFDPTIQDLHSCITEVSNSVATALSTFERLPEILVRTKRHLQSGKESYERTIQKDEELRKINRQIAEGLTENSKHLRNYLSTWDNYKEIWEINKSAFIKRYQRLNPPVASFDADIGRYTEVSNNVQKEETVLSIEFILLDCSPLKFALLAHCNEWQERFTTLLKDMSTKRLKELTEFLQSNSEDVLVSPTTLEELGDRLDLWERLHGRMQQTEARISPIHDQFSILEKYEVTVPEETKRTLENLGNEWVSFQQCVIDAEVSLKKHKERFKGGLLAQADEFQKKVSNAVNEFNNDGPFTSAWSVKQAMDKISQFQENFDNLTREEQVIKRGLGIFKIDQPSSKELVTLSKDMDFVDQSWKLSKEWNDNWDVWKVGAFQTLQTHEMETTAQLLYKRATKLLRDLKLKNWEINESTKQKIVKFQKTMPLIRDLKNKAMRERHWEEIRGMLHKSFDPNSNDFTLETIVEMGFADIAEPINEISSAASKELAIEKALDNISTTWEDLELDTMPYKDKGHHKLKNTEDIFTQLEDHQMGLTTMKASRFVKAFEATVDKWERALSMIMEVVEFLLTVQRQWMYLENIFLGEDIRKQLPGESADFDRINNSWKAIMQRVNEDKNARRATHVPGLLNTLMGMNTKLEEIQKSLDMYLETKRQIFPRFYFLSNDDLLEILGQSRNPEAVQPHLKKCFDNIKALQIKKSQNNKNEAHGMFSSEGEFVDFATPVLLEGPVEAWLCDIERVMRWNLKEVLKSTKAALKKMNSKRDKWVKEWPGQPVITASQIQWTTDCTRGLTLCNERQDKKPMKSVKKKQVSVLNKYSEAVRGNLNRNQRSKIVALVTIEVHARDVIDKLIKTNTLEVTAFEWLQQLRVYWDKDIDDCVVRATNTQFQYGYEYLGNSGRLVITPLTDRCYITLTTALHLHRGGSPKGPAGTGKTETTKDLGKALGMYVIVVNCSEGLDYKSMGRMFSGLSQTGAWGCFDEFNRINIEVLSVVAQQILCILSALMNNQQRFVFEGREIGLIWSCGMFITMNPGYAGRTELPDNLKSMFRPIAMVVPDSNLIAEILLFGEGFGNCRALARKVFTLYSLAIQQLSKQDHYDFGLRALTSVLRYAGKKKRANPEMADEEILLLSMKDMNIAKLTSADSPLFIAVIGDLFPGIETPTIDYGELKKTIVETLKEDCYQVNPHIILKVIQLYETKNSRHSSMIVGHSLGGKSVTWRVLQKTLITLRKNNVPGYNFVKDFPINPKALSLGELYGEFDLASNEWADGVLSSVMRQACADPKPDEKWLVFDAPVDTLWIESMNSVMDDNKILTLINGERISMPEQVSLLFELQDLSEASPATVSRCGMVYFDVVDLGYQPYIDSWLQKKNHKELAAQLRDLFAKWVPPLLQFKKYNCKELVPITDTSGVMSLCKLFDSLATAENGVNPKDSEENFAKSVELWFVFCMIWSICAACDADSRNKIDNYIRELESSIPNKDSVYEYFVDPKSRSWVNFEDKLMKGWKYPPNAPFYKIIVPTVDTVRYDFLVSALLLNGYPVLMSGPVGTGKTSISQTVLSKMGSAYSSLVLNMSSQTTSNNVQEIIESQVEKRTKGVYVPFNGKKMVCFMDDFNMPAKDVCSQPPLELMRMWIDYGFWYDRNKQTQTFIKGMLLLCAMGPPGGGRQVISMRIQTKFNLINMVFPSENQINRIYGTMINQKLQDFEEDVKPIGDIITAATVEIYKDVTEKFLPTPAKIHYLFNLRDISKVFQGLLRATSLSHDSRQTMTRLWMHECYRVFSDRLVDAKDHEKFNAIVVDKLATLFDTTFTAVCPNKAPPLFGDFISVETYEDLQNFTQVKTFMNNQLLEYNNYPGKIRMSLVLFKDAIEHIARIVRVIRTPRGNMMLIGIGGSGRQSLSRLASFICEYTTFQVEVQKNYRKLEFRDDLKKLYIQAGVENKPTVFIFSDTQATEEIFMEDINNILSSGEVPNLFKGEEIEDIKSNLEDEAKRQGIPDNNDAIFKFLIERVRANLHVCLCMSPVGDDFRNRVRQYPAFVNCTTIDWFAEWPKDALLEVAERYLEGMDLGDTENVTTNVASIFVTMHRSVVTASEKMLFELKRHNYVTPTNYLELVSGYKILLVEKRKELGDQVYKLRNGLFKIDDTREKVEGMTVDLEEATIKVAAFQKECEEYLVTLVQQKREADEQSKSVAAYGERIQQEAAKCNQMAEAAQRDLDEAVPALEAAMLALESLNKKDITEIKSYGRPPALVEMVMQAVMILKNSDPSWAEAKRQLGDGNFIKTLVNFDKDNMSDRVLKKIGQQYVAHPDFQPENVGRVSLAAQSLCMWVIAMEIYGRVFRVVEPKRQRLNAAMAQLAEKEASLNDAKNKLAAVQAKMEQLKLDYDKKLMEKDQLGRKAQETQVKLERAGKLVSGLAGEKIRWEATAESLEEAISYLIGDCLVSSAFLSYLGPFLTEYRVEMVQQIWLIEVYQLGVPCTPDFSFADFLSSPTQTREWNIQGLPSDQFSTENGVITKRGNRWPLMIDPQGQAIKWVKNMELKNDLKLIDLQQHDFLRTLENAIRKGKPVLLQNVKEDLDPSLAPILNKAVSKIGGKDILKLGDKDIEYNDEFKFYITTKLSNPHYPPEISSQTAIINFAVKEQGLEAQLLGAVVRKERPELEEQKDNLVLNIAAGKKKIKELEDEILRLLNDATGSLLDDEQLVNTLQSSKVTSADVIDQLVVAEQTEIKIDKAREGYRPCAQRASILFFVLNDMGSIDPMYQFSLDSFIDLFNNSIDKSQKSPNLEQRINNLNEYHTYAVYRYTCRGLFAKHKLLFSFQMCSKILEAQGKLNLDEYSFFLRGGVVLDREEQMDNPCTSWVTDACWDNITELDKLTNFHGIMNSFEQYPRDWHAWFISAEPETAPLPGEWENSCNELQKMVIVRSMRSDRVTFCATSFIVNNLGAKFVEPPVLEMNQVVDDSTTKSPLIFVLSTGVDPTGSLLQLADHCKMAHRFHALSLGQGQAPIATRMIKEGVKEGHWVFLANCHLSLSWMPQLDKLVEQLQVEEPHPDFRLWLSSSPNPHFPISILQAGIKMTTEPPKGLKANMKRLYHNITDKQFNACQKKSKYKKLLFSLCFFHSLLIERKKFLMLGWNILYEFNDSDFEVSENLISIYLDEYEDTPWDALKYLVAEVNYGGHVTDDWDRRLLHSHIKTCFTEASITTPFFKLSTMDTYYIPRDGPLGLYREFINQLPNVDNPEAFGQHPNADIASQISEARLLFETLISLQPKQATTTGVSQEDTVLELAANVLKTIPKNIDYEATAKVLADDPKPLNVVLLQEIERYNLLLNVIRKSLIDLDKGIQGLVLMSEDLEATYGCIFDGRVPPSWAKTYCSLKPLGSWTRDLILRIEQLAKWAETARPPILFWMSGFTFPTGFLTAVLQTSARANKVSVDTLSWEFSVATCDDKLIVQAPKDGVWVRGLFLEGASWDRKNSCLIEASPMQLNCSMPAIFFKPSDKTKKKAPKGMYVSPCYYFPNRSGYNGFPSFVVAVELKAGASPSDHWIKRGTALLMQLAL